MSPNDPEPTFLPRRYFGLPYLKLLQRGTRRTEPRGRQTVTPRVWPRSPSCPCAPVAVTRARRTPPLRRRLHGMAPDALSGVGGGGEDVCPLTTTCGPCQYLGMRTTLLIPHNKRHILILMYGTQFACSLVQNERKKTIFRQSRTKYTGS